MRSSDRSRADTMARSLVVRADRSLVRASGGSRRHLRVDGAAPRKRHRRPVSLGLVLDQSGSMAGPKMQLAKEGAIRAIRSLHDDDCLTTSTLGVGRDFDEGLLRRMAEAGGGNFYFAEYATQLSDFIAGATGESLGVVARNAALVIDLPVGAALTSPNPFAIRSEPGRSVVDLGDLVADQVLSLVFTVEFARGAVGENALVHCWLWDTEGALDGAAEHAFTYESSAACDSEPRDREVEHAMAFTYAAAARQESAELARKGALHEGREALRKMAQNFRRASRDPRVLEIARALEKESDVLGEMGSMESKRVEYDTSVTLHTRGIDGMSLGTAGFTAGRTLGALLHAERHGVGVAAFHVIVVTADRVGTRLVETAGRALAGADPQAFAYTIVDSATCVLDPGPGIAFVADDESALVYAVAAAGEGPKLAIVHGAFEDGTVFHWHPSERVAVASLDGWDTDPGGSAEALVAWQMVLQATRHATNGAP